jgi:thiamine-phosphate pyrophosphorylase
MHGLYVITDAVHQDQETLLAAVEAALTGGACMVQYREKRLSNIHRESIALELHALCRERGAPLVINDDVRLAQRVNAEGVHLGCDDVSVQEARQQLGAGKIIGVSCYADLQAARQAQNEGADYVAFGRFYTSQTKPNAAAAPVDILKQAKAEIKIPIVAIGGITAENGAALVAAGADMLAVVDGVFCQQDISQAARNIAALF